MACGCKNKSTQAAQAAKAQKIAEANRLRIREAAAKEQARRNAKK